MYLEVFEHILAALPAACREVYGDRLKALAVFGSVARGTPRPESDVDLLRVAADLPHGRRARSIEFEQVDPRLDPLLCEARQKGVNTWLSPILKTPQELALGSLPDLDMIDQARIMIDEGGLLRTHLDAVAARLKAMGARRVYRGGGYYWELKPDYRWGERITL